MYNYLILLRKTAFLFYKRSIYYLNYLLLILLPFSLSLSIYLYLLLKHT